MPAKKAGKGSRTLPWKGLILLKQGKIGSGQLVILLFVSRCFNILNFVPIFSQQLEPTALLLGSLAALPVQLLLLIPPLLLLRRFPEKNVISAAYSLWRPAGYLYAFLYFLLILFQLAGTLVGFSYFMTNAVYPNASTAFLILTLSTACFFCGRHGLEGIARASAIVFVFFLISTAAIALLSLPMVELHRFHPILFRPISQIAQAALASVGKSAELFLLILLYPSARGRMGRTSVGFVVLSLFMLSATNFLIQGVLGDYAASQTFPYYTLAAVSDTELLQRLDSLYMVNWVFTSFIRCTLLIIVGRDCLQTVLPQKTHRFFLPVMFIAASGAALALGYHTELLNGLNRSSSYGVGIMALTAVLPFILLLPKKRFAPSERGNGDVPPETSQMAADTR